MAEQTTPRRLEPTDVCALITDPILRALCYGAGTIYGGKRYATPPRDVLLQCMQTLTGQGVPVRAAGGQCVRAWDNGAGAGKMPGQTPAPTPDQPAKAQRPGDVPFTGGPVAGRDYGYGNQGPSLPHVGDLAAAGIVHPEIIRLPNGVNLGGPTLTGGRRIYPGQSTGTRMTVYRPPQPPKRPPWWRKRMSSGATISPLRLGIGGLIYSQDANAATIPFGDPVALAQLERQRNQAFPQEARKRYETALAGVLKRRRGGLRSAGILQRKAGSAVIQLPGVTPGASLGRSTATSGTVRVTTATLGSAPGSPHLPSATPRAVPSANKVAVPGADDLKPVIVTGSRATSAPPRATRAPAVRGSIFGSGARAASKLNLFDWLNILNVAKGRFQDPITIRNVFENLTTPGSIPQVGSGFAPNFLPPSGGSGTDQCDCSSSSKRKGKKRKQRTTCGRGTFVETRSGLRKTYSGGKHPCP